MLIDALSRIRPQHFGAGADLVLGAEIGQLLAKCNETATAELNAEKLRGEPE